MKNLFQVIIIYIVRLLSYLFHIFPIKRNRIFFSVHKGLAYNCNPKYIFEYMYDRWGLSYEYIWCLNNHSKIPSKYDVKCVKFLSVSHFYYLLTSKVVVNNLGIEPVFTKRKKQIFINTWHGGGAYKKLMKNKSISKLEIFTLNSKRNLRAKMMDYVISSCFAFTNAYATNIGFNLPKSRFLSIGMPRNDLFFNTLNIDRIESSIKDLYKIHSDKMIVLYAPTYRGNGRKPIHVDYPLNIKDVCEAVKKRFRKDCIVLYRHHIVEHDSNIGGAIDVSDYQDMQELLLITDVFITDYSSSIWDYSLTNRPAFLFTPDLEEYMLMYNFYTPIETWPFPFAKTSEELCDEILKYDEIKSKEKIRRHHSLLGSYETGEATSKICNLIKEYIDK